MFDSKIEWTKHTWNPWSGCVKAGKGCRFCYAENIFKKKGKNFKLVVRNRNAFHSTKTIKKPSLVFTCSMSDFFIQDADKWRAEAWEIIKATPHLQYQILTKRPERIKECLPDDWGEGYPNCWLGISGSDEVSTYNRLSILLQVPAKVRFLSAEPLLEDIVSDRNISLIRQLSWVIIGGESPGCNGKYRKMDAYWALDLMTVCRRNKVACFFKQTGTFLAKKCKYKDPKGGDPKEWPEVLRVRQFPAYKAACEKQFLNVNPKPKQLNQTP